MYTYILFKSTHVYMASKHVSVRGPLKRTRNAVATREAILQSALAAFSFHGYDGVGCRDIAQAAGVTGALVNRYFDSKEALFAAVVELSFNDGWVLEGDTSMLAERLTADLMSKTEKDAERGSAFSLLLRSAPNPRAAEILRETLEHRFERPLKSALRGPRAGERAAMILAMFMGVSLSRKILGSKALVDANAAGLSADLKGMFQQLIDNTDSRASPVQKRSQTKKRNQ
jgi:AcrR family transcriptional regulator